jgi:phage minor structural protein
MIPVLYKANETKFDSQGVGCLTDCITCYVHEKLNGVYELKFTYPITGVHFSDIKVGAIVDAIPSDGKAVQHFRIDTITKPIGGKVTVEATHISYQLSYVPVKPFDAVGVLEALNGLKDHSLTSNPFSVWTDISNTATKYSQKEPASFRQRLGGVAGSILDCFGGEYEFDNYTVKLHAHRGIDRGVVIEYGKNLTDLEQEESIDKVITGIVPFWKDSNDKVVSIETPIESEYASKYPFKRTVVKDFSSNFEEEPTVEQLRVYTESYIKNNCVGVPQVSLDVSFVALEDTEEYKNLSRERINLGDTVTVRFSELGVDAKAKVIEYKYDVLAERYDYLKIGSVRSSLASTISEITKVADSAVTKSILDAVIKYQTELIKGGLGGYVVTNYVNGFPSEIIVGDSPNIEQMVNCIRLNKNGLGISKSGYNGPYSTAITGDGVNASLINFGELDGNLIKAKTLQIGSFDEATENTITSSLSEAVTEWYVSTSPTELKGGSWSESRPAWTETNYIWQRLRTENKKGEISYSEPSCVQGNTGAKGDKGNDGTSVKITAKSVTYQASTSGTTTPTGAWVANPPTVAKGQYLWTKTVVTYSDGNSTTAYSVAYQGTNGANGQNGSNGRGVKSTEVTYQIWYNGTSTPNGTWVTTVPDTTADKPYLWTRTVITYTDDTKSTSYSVGSTLKGVNVGGRNLLLNSRIPKDGTYYLLNGLNSTENLFKNCRIFSAQKAWNGLRVFFNKHVTERNVVHVGDKLTYSIYAKTDNISPISIMMFNRAFNDSNGRYDFDSSVRQFTLSKEWAQYSLTFTVTDSILKTSGTGMTYFGFEILQKNTEEGKYVYFACPKLELGNVATDWTPAPEDVDADISNAQSTANSAQTNASTAKQTANDAQSTANDALNKAGSAQASADSAIKSYQDAINKAKDAQISADKATELANGAHQGVSNIEQVVKIDAQGVRIYEKANSKNYVHQKSDGSHFYTNNTENGVLGPDSRMNNLAVNDYFMCASHRMEYGNVLNQDASVFYHIGKLKKVVQ